MKFLALLIGSISAQACVDSTGTDSGGDGCEWYYSNDGQCGWWDTDSFTAGLECCACENPHQWEEGCVDGTDVDMGGDGCDWYYANWSSCGDWDTDTFTSATDCCACFGGDGSCVETQDTTDLGGDDCDWYWANQDSCADASWDDSDFSAANCCACM